MCNVCVLPQQIASLGTRGEPFFSWHMKLRGERAFKCCIQTSSCAQLQNLKKKEEEAAFKHYYTSAFSINSCTEEQNGSDRMKTCSHLSYYYVCCSFNQEPAW